MSFESDILRDLWANLRAQAAEVIAQRVTQLKLCIETLQQQLDRARQQTLELPKAIADLSAELEAWRLFSLTDEPPFKIPGYVKEAE